MSDKLLIPVSSKEKILVALLATIQFTHILDFVIMMPLGPFFMQELKIGTMEFGVLVSSYNLSSALTGILFATIADRFDKRKLMTLSQGLFAFGTLVCILSVGYYQLLSARILAGAFSGIINVLVFTFASDLIPFERRGKALGVIMSSFSVASVLGVPVGLLLADTFGRQYSFMPIFIITLLATILGYKILPPIPARDKSQTKISKRLLNLLSPIKIVEQRWALILVFISSFCTFILIPFISPYAVNNLLVSTENLKYMYLIGGGLTVLSAQVIGRITDAKGPALTYIIIALLSCIPIICYSYSSPMPLWLFFALSAIFMALVSGRFIPLMTMVTEVPGPESRGSFMSILHAVRSSGMALSSLIGGMIILDGPDGKLLRFDLTGNISIALQIFCLGIVFKFGSIFKRAS